jgi:hypothetical protein
MTLNPVGYSTTIDCKGDSLTQGTGGSGQNIATCLAAFYPHRIVNNHGIGGQTAQQIAARQGGLPVTLTISGGSAPAAFATAAVTPSTQFLSTPADNTTRYASGIINGYPVTLSRSATGGPPSTSEAYTIMGAGNPSAVTPPAWAPFVPDEGWNSRDSIQVLWLGRNNVADLSPVAALIAQCVSYIHDPKRYVVIGVLAALNETSGTSTGIAIASLNATLSTTYGSLYVASTPPTTAEMTAVGYTPTTQDNTDIANGVWPTGLRSDVTGTIIHLTGPGYMIFANRVKAVIDTQGW